MVTILAVDDSPQWLNFHKQNILSMLPDAMVDFAMSGSEGLRKVLDKPDNYYDIILCDMQMEHVLDEPFAGQWLIKRLLPSGKCDKTKIVVVSAVFNIEEVAKNLGVCYISKSIIASNPANFEYKLKEMLKLS